MLFIITGCLLDGDCDYDILEEVISPDQGFVIIVYIENCGATFPFYTTVHINEIGHIFDPKKKGHVVFSAKGKHDISVAWEDPMTVNVTLNAMTKNLIFKKLNAWEGIEFNYTGIVVE